MLYLAVMVMVWMFFLIPQADAIELTDVEKRWLDNNRDKLILYFDWKFPPLEYLSPEGTFAGLGADVIHVIEKRLGVTFDKQVSTDWLAHLNSLKTGESAVAPVIVDTPAREDFAYFTPPYAEVPVVIITTRSNTEATSLDDFEGRRVAVVAGFASADYVKQYARGRFEVVEVNNVQEGLRDVSFGVVDALVENLAVAAYYIEEEGLPNLRVAGSTEYSFKFSIAVSRKYPALASIMNKALADIPPDELEAIRKKWIHLDNPPFLSERGRFILLTVGVSTAVMILMLVVLSGMLERQLKDKVSRLNQTEIVLRKSNKRFEDLVNLLPQAVCEIDAHGKLLFVNQKALDMFGYSEAELLNALTVFDLVRVQDHKQLQENFQGILAGGNAAGHEYVALRKDGSALPVIAYSNTFEMDSGAMGLRTIVVDISQHKAAEADRERLLKAMEQVHDYVMITNAAGAIEYVNDAFEHVTGYASEEAIGANPRILKSGKHGKRFYRAMWDTISSGHTWRGLIVDRKKDGTRYTNDACISPVFDAEGNIIQYVSVNRDVTQVMELEAQLRRSQKMEAIGTLAGGIAHDFNNILSAILGFADLALDAGRNGEDPSKDIEQVITACSRARDLVTQILTISRQKEGEKRPLDIRPIVKETAKLLRASIPTSIEICTHIDEARGVVMADPSQIQQVLMNLCTNAAHAMRESGGLLEITLARKSCDAPDFPTHATWDEMVFLMLEVRDTGHGMPRDVLDRMYEPYFTTKKSGEGTGLGLAIVHGIVEQHGGIIAAESESGIGTAFRVFFPICDIESQAPVADSIAEDSAGSERVLFVDDEAPIVAAIQRGLEKLGYHVTAVNSAAEALQLFEKAPDAFDVIIADLTMPEISGLELLRIVREIKPTLPTILCSGFARAQHEPIANASRVISMFIEKPIDSSRLGRAIRKVMKPRNRTIPEQDTAI